MSAEATHVVAFGAEDDQLHDVGDRWWATETSWFSFHNVERRLGGWLYTLIRPNIGTVQGGAWVWDGSGTAPWEIRYSANHTSKRFDPATDLRKAQLDNGVSIEVVRPLHTYRVGYSDPGRLEADLRFEAVMAPFPFAKGEPPFLAASHFDQTGRVTGSIVLDGEVIEIDCFSVRDRSWGPRPEHRPRRLSYCFGTASADHGFFTTSSPGAERDVVNHGYLLRDGRTVRIVSGERQVQRHPESGLIVGEQIEGVDEEGVAFRAVGTPVSATVINRHMAITWTYLMRWELDGVVAWGEDQDMWPVVEWSAFHRARTARQIR